MNEFETKINILTDIVIEKNEMLKVVLNISTNQKELLISPNEVKEMQQIFMSMTLEKQKQIDQILESDKIFNQIFESLVNFEDEAKQYKESVKKLQNAVKATTDTDMKIRLQEEENKNLISKKINKQEGPTQVIKKDMLNKYKINSKFKDGEGRY